ncbi:hypothetical protein Pan153_00490 [Gimesia panareensis]|uniref:Lipoprotein n=1 Tax=Gimesia panareensis TaxID=2527978 RepID=A0A518FGG8_9PLAN|nr:DUF6348 family protein [Gimesia panareensis]QDV15435.1 hypothetical protein Pan153_00490 [Gimesia panareensis]
MLKLIRNLLLALITSISGCSTKSYQPPADIQGDAKINSLILQLLEQHGIDAREENGWIVSEAHPPVCGAVVNETQPTPDIISTQIDIYLKVEPNRILVESFGGFGTNLDEAIADGIQNFVVNTFHVLLSAFYLEKDDQTVIEEWKINDIPRRVIIGQIGMRGTPPEEEQGAPEWFQNLENKIKATSLPAGTHWIRCYYAQMENRPVALELLLDNQPWEEVRSEMEKIDWPESEEFFSLRVFLVIQNIDEK